MKKMKSSPIVKAKIARILRKLDEDIKAHIAKRSDDCGLSRAVDRLEIYQEAIRKIRRLLVDKRSKNED